MVTVNRRENRDARFWPYGRRRDGCSLGATLQNVRNDLKIKFNAQSRSRCWRGPRPAQRAWILGVFLAEGSRNDAFTHLYALLMKARAPSLAGPPPAGPDGGSPDAPAVPLSHPPVRWPPRRLHSALLKARDQA